MLQVELAEPVNKVSPDDKVHEGRKVRMVHPVMMVPQADEGNAVHEVQLELQVNEEKTAKTNMLLLRVGPVHLVHKVSRANQAKTVKMVLQVLQVNQVPEVNPAKMVSKVETAHEVGMVNAVHGDLKVPLVLRGLLRMVCQVKPVNLVHPVQ